MTNTEKTYLRLTEGSNKNVTLNCLQRKNNNDKSQSTDSEQLIIFQQATVIEN